MSSNYEPLPTSDDDNLIAQKAQLKKKKLQRVLLILTSIFVVITWFAWIRTPTMTKGKYSVG